MDDHLFVREYIRRVAYALAQFWGASHKLPHDERDTETYYRVLISRLSIVRRIELVREMRRLQTAEAKFFSVGVLPAERKQTIDDVLRRFPQLEDAEYEFTCKQFRI